jgi:hypothetical protein
VGPQARGAVTTPSGRLGTLLILRMRRGRYIAPVVAFSNRSPVECEPVSVERNASAHGGRILTAETGGGSAARRAYWRPAYAGNHLSAPLSHGNHARFLVTHRNANCQGVVGGGRSPCEPVCGEGIPWYQGIYQGISSKTPKRQRFRCAYHTEFTGFSRSPARNSLKLGTGNYRETAPPPGGRGGCRPRLSDRGPKGRCERKDGTPAGSDPTPLRDSRQLRFCRLSRRGVEIVCTQIKPRQERISGVVQILYHQAFEDRLPFIGACAIMLRIVSISLLDFSRPLRCGAVQASFQR